MNARFWVFANGGPVKLTLKPDQSLSWSRWRRTEEGWEEEAETWTHKRDRVRREWVSSGQDCDGVLERFGEDWCSLDCLRKLEPCSDSGPNFEGVRWPEWEEEYRGQSDQYAEMAGY